MFYIIEDTIMHKFEYWEYIGESFSLSSTKYGLNVDDNIPFSDNKFFDLNVLEILIKKHAPKLTIKSFYQNNVGTFFEHDKSFYIVTLEKTKSNSSKYWEFGFASAI